MKQALIILMVILLMPIGVFAEKGFGIEQKFDVNTTTMKQSFVTYISAFSSHLRAFAHGDYGEDLNSADKLWAAGASVLYVPRPLSTYGVYFEIGGESEWLDTEVGTENFLRGAVGIGGFYQFGPQDAVYLGYLGRSKNENEASHTVVARLVFGFE